MYEINIRFIKKLINNNNGLNLNLFFSLEIRLEKYKNIINNPLIIIKNKIIEYIKFWDHLDIIIHVIIMYEINIIIMKIGCKLLIVKLNIIVNISNIITSVNISEESFIIK